jgi:hypothetical protein
MKYAIQGSDKMATQNFILELPSDRSSISNDFEVKLSAMGKNEPLLASVKPSSIMVEPNGQSK